MSAQGVRGRTVSGTAPRFEIGVVYKKNARYCLAVSETTLITFNKGGKLQEVKPYAKYEVVRTISVEELCKLIGVSKGTFYNRLVVLIVQNLCFYNFIGMKTIEIQAKSLLRKHKKIETNDQLFAWDKRFSFDVEHQQSKHHKMVSGCSLCSS